MTEETIFRRQEVAMGEKVITLQYKPITEIFKFEEPPYIIVGASTSGKTTLCIDILSKFSKECTNIYYVTSTEENIKDDSISMIPRAFRRKPKFKTLYNVWKEIRAQHMATNVDPIKLGNMLITLIDKEKATVILNKLQSKRDEIQKEQLARYRQSSMDENKAIQYAKEDAKAFYIDTITKIILDLARTVGTRKFSADDMLVLSGFISKAPRVLLLLDDVSSEMDSLKRDNHRVEYEGEMIQTGKAYESLLVDILTRGRHYGALICMFLHSIEIINQKSYINNLILLNDGAAQKVANARTFSEDMRKVILTVRSYVFNSNFPYHFLYLNSLDLGKLAVSKASLHINEDLELSSANKLFIKAYNEVASGTTNDNNTIVDDNDDDEEYYSDEYSDNGGDLSSYINSIK